MSTYFSAQSVSLKPFPLFWLFRSRVFTHPLLQVLRCSQEECSFCHRHGRGGANKNPTHGYTALSFTNNPHSQRTVTVPRFSVFQCCMLSALKSAIDRAIARLERPRGSGIIVPGIQRTIPHGKDQLHQCAPLWSLERG